MGTIMVTRGYGKSSLSIKRFVEFFYSISRFTRGILLGSKLR
jgi:hypothetical protein